MSTAQPTESLVWKLRHPVWVAVGLALIPVLFTAGGSAIAQITEATVANSYLLTAAGVAVSALIGIGIMIAAKPTLSAFGFRRPVNLRDVWWLAPLAFVVVIALVTGGITVTGSTMLAILVLTSAVGTNEEVFFRGLILTALRSLGDRRAVLSSALLFGILHPAGLAGGASSLYTALQVVFAFLFGWVAAEVVVITRSIWPGIVWHILYDAASYLGGDTLTPVSIAGAIANCVVLAIFGTILWRKLPQTR